MDCSSITRTLTSRKPLSATFWQAHQTSDCRLNWLSVVFYVSPTITTNINLAPLTERMPDTKGVVGVQNAGWAKGITCVTSGDAERRSDIPGNAVLVLALGL